MKSNRNILIFCILAILCCLLFVVDIMVGSVDYSFGEVVDALMGKGDAVTVKIVRDIRFVKAIVAMFAGAALSVSGLQMQTLFRNPLAGPYVLGITSGASLGVALALLGAPVLGYAGSQWFASFGQVGAAWIGSALVLVMMAAVAMRLRNIMAILILGMMFSSGVGAIVQVLQYLSHEDALKSYVVWTMGSLGDVTGNQLWVLIGAELSGLVLAAATVKPLNLLLLGERYAMTMGLNIVRSRMLLFLSTILLAGTVTAFCGPIGFIGLAIPHVTRALFRNSDHRILLPGTIFLGIIVMLVCDMLSKSFVLPVNSITSLIGIPIVIWIVIRSKNFSAR